MSLIAHDRSCDSSEVVIFSQAHRHDPPTWALHRLCKIVIQAALSIGSADSLFVNVINIHGEHKCSSKQCQGQ